MGKSFKLFSLLLLIAIIFTQHLQVERERDNWRKFRFEMDVMQANAVVPVVAVGLRAATPWILSSLVGGTTFYWCYTHGGKEAWIRVAKLTLDGAVITKDWVRREIAKINGIDTEQGSSGLYDGYAIYNGVKYNFILDCSSLPSSYPCNYPPNTFNKFQNNQCGAVGVFSDKDMVCHFVGSFSPVGFNPADYPHLYAGPALLTNCHAVAKAHPGLLPWVDPVPSSVRPDDAQDNSSRIVPIVAQMEDNSLVDVDGRKWMAPMSEWLPNYLKAPMLENVSSVAVENPKEKNIWPPVALPGEVILPKAVGEELSKYVQVGGRVKGLTHIGGSVANPALEWVNVEGKTTVTPIPLDLAAKLSGTIPEVEEIALPSSAAAAGAAANTKTIIHPNNPESDPGNPSDASLPDVPLFDPVMDWGEEEPWPWEKWLGSLPFIDVLKSSSINLAGSTSVVSCELSFLGKSKFVSYDFSAWSGLLNSMGIIVYACSCWYALQLALLKRD